MALTELLSLPLVVTAIILFVSYLLVQQWKLNRNLPPGPWSLPVIGYYPFLPYKPHVYFAKLAKKYGEVFSFRSAGGKLFVILNGHEQIKDALVNRSEEFTGKPIEKNSLEWISNGLGVAQEEGSSWKEHRRYFLQTVKNFGFGKMEIEGTIHEEMRILVRDLYASGGQPTDFNFHIAYVVSSTITEVLFARKFDKNGDVFPKLRKSVHDLVDVISDQRLMLVGYPFMLAVKFSDWGADMKEGRSFLRETVKEIIEDHIKTFDPSNLRDYVDSYLYHMQQLKESGEIENSTFTMERLLAIAMNMTMEGTDSPSIVGLLNEASKHPEEQRRVQEELDAVVGKERLPSWADRTKLPYLEAFIQELFRTAQSFNLTTHYSNFQETKIQGYRIPKRSIILGNLWSINNDPKMFPNPSKFDVNRFLGEDGAKLKTDGPYPFSMGKRSCVGKSLAQMEVFSIVSSVLQSFSLEPTGKKGILRAIPRQ